MEPTTPTGPEAKGNWWTRNWKWFVPTGCLTILALFLVFIASIVIIVFGAIKSTDPYKDALARAEMHPAVIEASVRRSRKDFLFLEIRTLMAPAAEANLAIPISGPKGKGTIYVKRRSRSGAGPTRI